MEEGKESYSIVIPPPNVTGNTSYGGIYLITLSKDTLVRYKRMCGYNTLWLPGCDHAGNSYSKLKLKRKLAEEGLKKEETVSEEEE